jgi:16S rRNA (cytosine1402-N4)-methyltransferase
MLDEVLTALAPQPGEVMVDATIGGGGHAAQIAARLQPGGRLIGIDQDPEARKVLAPFGESVRLIAARFDSLGAALAEQNIEKVDGVLFDLGVSSYQLDMPIRGFSFKDPDAKLDMRMNPQQAGPTAADLLNTLPERELAALIRENSDERWAARIARFAAERRVKTPYVTVGQLVETVLAAMPAGARPEDKHAATRTFQALRIAVNDELTVLQNAMEDAGAHLKKGGRIVVLSYHSLEDRIVKRFLATQAGKGEGQGPYGMRPPAVMGLLTKRPLSPSAEEVAANPRARSAHLRAAYRLSE